MISRKDICITQKAKTGDVLVANVQRGELVDYPNNSPFMVQITFIYRKVHSDDNIHSECIMYSDGSLYPYRKLFFKEFTTDIRFATKEQSNLLFKKMNNAGYMFDYDKLELKRIVN